MVSRRRSGISYMTLTSILFVLILAVAALAYLDASSANSAASGQQNQISSALTAIKSQSSVASSQESRINSLLQQLQSLRTQLQQQNLTLLQQSQNITATLRSRFNSLPLMNQAPTVRTLTMTWYLSPEAHQDRFDPSFPVVNQGDTIRLTLIDNDTVAHDLVIGPPYNIVVNATVPGLIDDLTGQNFTTPATNNSPGVVVTGTPGNVTATYSFIAKYAGVYEFVCTYHAQVGMIGYLVVRPNGADSTTSTTSTAGHPGTGQGNVSVSIVPGAGSDTTIKGYSPGTIRVVLGVNSTVTWVNNDSAPHTVTADDGSFGSSNIAPGSSFTYTFTTAGTFKYHCVYHPWMTGTVVVVK